MSSLPAEIAPAAHPPAGRRAILAALERKVLWLAAWTIHNANHLRPSRDGLKVGGHQASCASLASIMTALYFDVLRPEDRVAVKPHAAPVFHAIQYLFGRESRERLERFRSFGGAQAYPSRGKDDDDVDFSTGSVGLGAAQTVFGGAGARLPRLQGADRAGLGRADGRAGGRCRARRGQRVRGPAGELEARCARPLVGGRLQPPEPRFGGLGPAVRGASTSCSARSAGGW